MPVPKLMTIPPEAEPVLDAEPAPPAKVPVPLGPPPIHGFEMPDGLFIQVLSAAYRPPGRIADQTTWATGAWCRIKDGEWYKTAVVDSKVWQKTRKAKTAAAALALLLEGA